MIKLKFGGNVTNALLECFPDIGLDSSKLSWSQGIVLFVSTNVYLLRTVSWKSPDKRRQFFLDYAANHNFSPLMADNWYPSNTQTNLVSQKVDTLFCNVNFNLC